MSDIQRDLQVFRDNVRIVGNEITELQRKLSELVSEPHRRETRIQQDVQKAQRLVEKYQSELEKTQVTFEQALKENATAQDKAVRAREVYTKLEIKLRDEQNKTQHDQDRELSKINNDITLALRKQKSWQDKVGRAEDDQRKQRVANDNHEPGSRSGRQQTLHR